MVYERGFDRPALIHHLVYHIPAGIALLKSKKAERSLDNLAKTMDRVRKSFSAIDTTQFKNLCASSGEFVSKDGSEVDSEYVKYMNNVVSNKITMSRYIMKYDYYRKVLGG